MKSELASEIASRLMRLALRAHDEPGRFNPKAARQFARIAKRSAVGKKSREHMRGQWEAARKETTAVTLAASGYLAALLSGEVCGETVVYAQLLDAYEWRDLPWKNDHFFQQALDEL